MDTHEPATLVWRKSSYSGGNGDCVEVAPTPTSVLIRDSKSPATPHLTIPTPRFRHFLHAL